MLMRRSLTYGKEYEVNREPSFLRSYTRDGSGPWEFSTPAFSIKDWKVSVLLESSLKLLYETKTKESFFEYCGESEEKGCHLHLRINDDDDETKEDFELVAFSFWVARQFLTLRRFRKSISNWCRNFKYPIRDRKDDFLERREYAFVTLNLKSEPLTIEVRASEGSIIGDIIGIATYLYFRKKYCDLLEDLAEIINEQYDTNLVRKHCLIIKVSSSYALSIARRLEEYYTFFELHEGKFYYLLEVNILNLLKELEKISIFKDLIKIIRQYGYSYYSLSNIYKKIIELSTKYDMKKLAKIIKKMVHV